MKKTPLPYNNEERDFSYNDEGNKLTTRFIKSYNDKKSSYANRVIS